MKNVLKEITPMPVIWAAKYALHFPRDIFDSVLGRRGAFIPPTRFMFDGIRNVRLFQREGKEYFKIFTDVAKLKPYEKILDVGCGIGRKTIPLIGYLNEQGRYEGIDTVKAGIDWLRRKISKNHPNFRFQLIDVYNKHYNPNGKYKASTYRFPFEEGTFDFVVLGSVFTHMLPEDMEHYLSEIRRVLKTGGRCLITFFLTNDESLNLMDQSKSALNFGYDRGVYRTENARRPEDAVCYDESFVLGLYEKGGLKVIKPIHYGSWCGRKKFLSFQDIILAVKR